MINHISSARSLIWGCSLQVLELYLEINIDSRTISCYCILVIKLIPERVKFVSARKVNTAIAYGVLSAHSLKENLI
jgi:hypothetical protein